MIAAAVRVAVHVLLTMLGAAPVGAEPAQPVQRQVSAMPDVGQLIKRTYVSPVDGAELEYAAWLPPQYEQRQDWPLIVFLHGSGEGEDWAAPTKPQASIPVLDTQKSLPFVVVFPLMRGSWSINALAQCDVLDVLADAQANLHVDADRVHLVGLSLGGFTAWRIATAHPDLFATLTLLCAGGDAALAGNVRNLPIRIYQGARDPVVPVALARELRAALGKVRADVQYVEFPEGDHIIWRGPLASEDLYRWMAQHRRPQQPQRVTYRTVLPRYHRAYWVDVVARRRADLPAFVDAIIAPGTGAVVVHAENMARLDLRPPAGLIGAGTPTFFLDGERVDAQAIEGGWRIELEPVAEEGLRKWPGLAGPIQDVLLGPFVVAIAADENGEQIPAWQLAAHEGFAWTQRLVAHRIRSIPANEVTEELEQHVNLICFGDESNHPLLAALADQLPPALRRHADSAARTGVAGRPGGVCVHLSEPARAGPLHRGLFGRAGPAATGGGGGADAARAAPDAGGGSRLGEWAGAVRGGRGRLAWAGLVGDRQGATAASTAGVPV